MSRRFALAPMSPMIRGLTFALFFLPPIFVGLSWLTADPIPRYIGLLMVVLYGVTWLCFRPSHFVVTRSHLDVVFPIWQRSLSLQGMSGARILDVNGFRQELGGAVRIGVGGLWGGFGWLWTSRRGLLEFYISRDTGMVLVEWSSGRKLLVTPEQPEEFMASIQAVQG